YEGLEDGGQVRRAILRGTIEQPSGNLRMAHDELALREKLAHLAIRFVLGEVPQRLFRSATDPPTIATHFRRNERGCTWRGDLREATERFANRLLIVTREQCAERRLIARTCKSEYPRRRAMHDVLGIARRLVLDVILQGRDERWRHELGMIAE